MRLKEKLIKAYPAIKWTEEIESLRSLVEREDAIPLHHEDVMGLVLEMDDREQRRMATLLLLPYAHRPTKLWPKQLFIKSVRSALQQASSDLTCKRRIILAILQQLHTRLGQDTEKLGTIQHHIESLVSRSELWHVYWMIYLHPDREEVPELWQASLHTVRERIAQSEIVHNQLHESAKETASTSSQWRDHPDPASELLHRKLNLLEDKLQKELKLRQKLELEVAHLNKQIRQHDRKHKILEQRLASEADRAERAEIEVQRLEDKLASLRQEHDQEQLTWRTEKKTLNLEAYEHRKTITDLRIQLKERAEETQRLRDQAREIKKSLCDRGFLLNELIHVSYKDLSRIGQQAATLTSDRLARHQLRDSLRELLTQIEVLESYCEGVIPVPTEVRPESKMISSGTVTADRSATTTPTSAVHMSMDAASPSTTTSSETGSSETSLTSASSLSAHILDNTTYTKRTTASSPSLSAMPSPSPSSVVTDRSYLSDRTTEPTAESASSGSTTTLYDSTTHSVHPHQDATSDGSTSTITYNSNTSSAVESMNSLSSTGTFYRRDHGGFICLDNGESFNIPESVVVEHKLQHEAEVLCRPIGRQHGSVMYHIELLFQGDDSYSPIHQYDGYIERGDQEKLYCVDLNNPTNRYPIHRRDVEIQKPEEGMPCTFNVAEDGEYARLSRLYRDYMPPPRHHEDPNTPTRKQVNRANKSKGEPTPKPEPYLSGCTITILGGQRKWFDQIVSETGAELIHDSGDNPERIAPSMRRCNALFMMITATSHRATWIGVEIAKENGIPHFIIQGSKSNLRMLLWDNQEVIRGKQRLT